MKNILSYESFLNESNVLRNKKGILDLANHVYSIFDKNKTKSFWDLGMSHTFNEALPKKDVKVLDDILKTMYEAYLDKDKQRLKWETEIFNLVKDFYTKIGDKRIAQYTNRTKDLLNRYDKRN